MASHVGIGSTGAPSTSAVSLLRWAIDRWLAVVYGFVYDLIFECFTPYRALEGEVLSLVQAGAPSDTPRRMVRVLDLGCGPGTFALSLAAAGFSVLGIDRYTALLDAAREKRRARGLTNLAFSSLEIEALGDADFDQLVSVHALYVHPAPDQLVREAARVLKPGGHAIFVNHVKRFAAWPTFRAAVRSTGFLHALGTLVWLVPNVVFETVRRHIGPHYWNEQEFTTRLGAAGFSVLQVRRTFLDGGSLLVWARREARA
jgi:SAM-dependent methyltransferase